MKKIFKTLLICCIILSQAQFLQAQSGESLNFANGDYVDFGNTLGNFGTGNFTFETWFKTTATNQTIISKRPACSAGNFWNVRITATGKVYFEMCENSSLLNLFFAETPSSYNDGNWHHMATVRDGTQMRIIIDGYIAVSVNNAAITNINNSTSLRLGSSSCNGFVGQLDETRLWSSARSQCNVYTNRLFEFSATPSALLLNCHYNQGVANATNTSVTTLTDFSDYNNIGTLIGFNLSGTTSNWVDDGCNAQGNTSAPAIGTTTATGCNNYTWNGTTYTSSGMYTSTFNAANGCDSISTLELMIGKPVSGGNDTACFGTILKPKATTLINPVQDQSNLTYNAVANGGSPWQSFTPAINGTIRYFEAEIRTPLSGMAATVFVELYEGQGTGGTLLGTSAVKTISSTSTYAFTSFDFSAQGIYLESGQLYTARLVTSSFNQAWFRLSTTNPYPNGLLNNNASQDLKFKTTMCEIKWYTAVTGGTLVPNPSTASLGSTTFYAEAYDGISCYSNRTPVTLTIESPLVGSNASATAVCSGGSVILTGTGAHSYTWSNGVSNGVAFIPTTTTTFTVTGTDLKGCTNTSTRTIVVNPIPSVGSNASATTVCSGGSVILTGTGAHSYTWSNGVSNSVAFIPTTTSTFTVTGTDLNGCTNTSTQTITVNTKPIVGSNASVTTICSGESVTLNGTGANTYSWSGGITNGVAFNLSATTTFTVTGTSANGCTNTSTRTILVNPLPIVGASTLETTVCPGNSVTLNGTGANTYSWSGGISNNVAFVPSTTTTYTVTGIDANGCANTSTIKIYVYLGIVSGGNDTGCVGNILTPSAQTLFDPTIDQVTTLFHPAYGVVLTSYWQSFTPSVTGTLNALEFQLRTPMANTSTIVTLRIYEGEGIGGKLLGSINKLIPASSTFSFHNFDVSGNNVYLKQGQVYTARVSTNSENQYWVLFNSSNPYAAGRSNIDPNIDFLMKTYMCRIRWYDVPFGGTEIIHPSWSSIGNTTFYAQASQGASCASRVPVSLSIQAPPSINVSGVSNLCLGDTTTLTANGANTYTWMPGSVTGSTRIVSPTTTTTYTVTGADVHGCTNTSTRTIVVNPKPSVGSNASVTTVCSGGSVILTGTGAISYTWSNGVSNGVAFIPTTTTTFTVTGTDLNGCTNTSTRTIVVNPKPSVGSNASVTAVCSGGSVILTGTGANSYTWSNGVSNGVAFIPTTTTTYTVTGTSADGCTNTATKNILVHANPTIILSGLDTACNGLSTTFTVSGASTYLWMPGNLSGSSNALSPSVNTIYTVTGTDANLCTSTVTKTLHIKERIVPDITPLGDTMFCSGASVFLYTNPFSSSASMPTCIPITQINTAAISAYTSAANPVNCTCPSGYVAVGYKGRVGFWMDQFQLACRKLNGNGTLDSTVVYTASLGTSNGGSAVGPFLLSGNNILVGGKGWASTSTSTNFSSFRGYGQNIEYILSQQSNANNPNSGPLMGSNTNYHLGTQFALPGYVIIGIRGPNTVSTKNMEFITVPFAEYFASSYTWNTGGNNSSKIANTDGIHTVTVTDANGCQSSASLPVIVLPDPQVLAIASDSTICVGNPVTLSGSGAINYTWNLGVTDNDPITPHTTKTYTVTGTDAFGCTNTSNITVVVDPCGTTNTMNVKLFLQGFYIGTSTMQTALMNQGVGNSVNHVDSIQVELRASENLTNIVTTSWAVLQIDGTATVNFTSLPFGYYRIVIKHRNHLETWSAEPVLITANSTYDFSTAANKAYGSNQVQVENGIWAFFTGDINQDGVVDGLDYNDWENDSNNFAGGYFSTDLNGDGIVDGLDFIFWEQNSNNFVGAVVP